MGLASCKELLQDAYRNGYAVGEFTIRTFDMAEAIIRAARECDAPAIIGVHRASFARKETFDNLVPAVVDLVKRSDAEVGVHLDHGDDLDDIVAAIDAGVNSVMIDLTESGLPFDEIVRLNREVVDYAHPRGVAVEGEVGHMASGEPGIEPPAAADKSGFTDPQQAQDFVARTGVDYLTVSIGTVHGHYAGPPEFDFDRLAEIRSLVDVPLILHGGSGTPCEMAQRAISLGVTRINIYTEYGMAVDRAVRRYVEENPSTIHTIPNAIDEAMDAVVSAVKARINCFTVDMRNKAS